MKWAAMPLTKQQLKLNILDLTDYIEDGRTSYLEEMENKRKAEAAQRDKEFNECKELFGKLCRKSQIRRLFFQQPYFDSFSQPKTLIFSPNRETMSKKYHFFRKYQGF